MLTGRAAAQKNLADARAMIEKRNQLARAVRYIYSLDTVPVARMLIGPDPLDIKNGHKRRRRNINAQA